MPTTEPRYGPQSPASPPNATYTRPAPMVSAGRCWSYRGCPSGAGMSRSTCTLPSRAETPTRTWWYPEVSAPAYTRPLAGSETRVPGVPHGAALPARRDGPAAARQCRRREPGRTRESHRHPSSLLRPSHPLPTVRDGIMVQMPGSSVPPAIDTFVAIGDSFTEGLNDPAPGGGFRGWADLVAGALSAQRPGTLTFRYANLAIRGKLLGQVVTEQVPRAVELAPDLVSLAAGGEHTPWGPH